MLTTLSGIMESLNINIQDTVYKNEKNGFITYPLTVTNLFSVCEDESKAINFYTLNQYYKYIQSKVNQKEYKDLVRKVAEVKNQTKLLKKDKRKSELDSELISLLRDEKREVYAKMHHLMQSYIIDAMKIYNIDVTNNKFIEYKKTLVVSSFSNIVNYIPVLEKVELARLKNTPLFVSGMAELKHAYENKEDIGIMGGPCLFGRDEVIVKVLHTDASEHLFDFSNGFPEGELYSSGVVDLHDHIHKYTNYIKDIQFINNKKGVTQQEYESLKYVFEIGSALNAKIVIPIPDLSYIKYCINILEPIENAKQDIILARFIKIAYAITDMYLEVIEELVKGYTDIEYKVFHKREEKLCKKFYACREPFLIKGSYLDRITGKVGKQDAIVDYITMLALPYYFYKTKHVIQVDSSDEADAHRKCKQIHKNGFSLYGILYPEYLSGDGKNTIYNARLKDKEYMTKEVSVNNE